jgi:hypothetical protein
MLKTRTSGLREYLSGKHDPTVEKEPSVFLSTKTCSILAIDSRISFGSPVLGWKESLFAVIHPIPRAIWPGKPMGLTCRLNPRTCGGGRF